MKARIHWNQQYKMWTIHTYKGCEWGEYMLLNGDWYTETKPNNRSNPRGFVVCDRSQVQLIESGPPPRIMFDQRLVYDKDLVSFNITSGNGIIFTPGGAYAGDLPHHKDCG